MTHSHLSARHLLRQIESDRARRPKRDRRPAWLTSFVEFAAELFEPFAAVGRVGYECRLDEQGWVVDLFLGAVELVGGKEDGQRRNVPFHFDLLPLLDRFTSVASFTWTVPPRPGSEISGTMAGDERDQTERSCLAIDGKIGSNRVRLAVHSLAPDTVGPGLRRLPDGRFEPI